MESVVAAGWPEVLTTVGLGRLLAPELATVAGIWELTALLPVGVVGVWELTALLPGAWEFVAVAGA